MKISAERADFIVISLFALFMAFISGVLTQCYWQVFTNSGREWLYGLVNHYNVVP